MELAAFCVRVPGFGPYCGPYIYQTPFCRSRSYSGDLYLGPYGLYLCSCFCVRPYCGPF